MLHFVSFVRQVIFIMYPQTQFYEKFMLSTADDGTVCCWWLAHRDLGTACIMKPSRSHQIEHIVFLSRYELGQQMEYILRF